MLHIPSEEKVTSSSSSLTAAAVPLEELAAPTLLEVPVAPALLEVCWSCPT